MDCFLLMRVGSLLAHFERNANVLINYKSLKHLITRFDNTNRMVESPSE
jgi:hypothetical protein